jgi:hypothetical protein
VACVVEVHIYAFLLGSYRFAAFLLVVGDAWVVFGVFGMDVKGFSWWT